ncbi:MAG TPA: translocation/assembly module TamB domain-containing protein, partial [Spirochaetota bacterium]|nr:translocation/assembly module TamB domain-containing protein [Spirochaetota bacterium]
VRNGNAHGYGEVVFNGLKFERYLFKLSSDIVPALINAGPVDARGLGKIEDFTIEGRDGVFNFIGNLMIDEAEVNLAGLMGAGGDKRTEPPNTLPINVFINFKAGKKVNINYPLVKGTVKQNDILVLKYIGNEPNIYLGGSLNLDKGEIYYFNKTFKIEQASFVFDENNTSINPVVNIKSSYRTKDSKGESVKLTLSLLDKLLAFKTEFSAFPYKTQDEIQGLLGISVSSSSTDIASNDNNNLTNTNSQNFDAIINTTNYLSNSFLFSPIENNIKRVTGLDTFAFNTNLFGNILRSNTNFLDVLDESSLSVGKYISDQIYLGSQMSFGKKNNTNKQ